LEICTLIVTFERDLLRDYGLLLDYLYENGLNLFYFYSETIDDRPVDLVEDILLSDSYFEVEEEVNVGVGRLHEITRQRFCTRYRDAE